MSDKYLTISFWKELGERCYINAYTLTALVFFVYISFFDKNNLITQYKLHQSVNDLEEEKEYYNEQINVIQETKKNLIEHRERLAREKYFMHEPDEDVYIIEK